MEREQGEVKELERTAEELCDDLRPLLVSLLIYKDVFTSSWMDRLSRLHEPEQQEVIQQVMSETLDEARRVTHRLHEWDQLGPGDGATDAVELVLTRLLEDLAYLKDRSVEAFLATGLRAPTEDLRQELIQCADIDRRHAEHLRKALRERTDHAPRSAKHRAQRVEGIHVGPFLPGTLSRTIQETVDAARDAGHPPARLIMSERTLRHVRDEGSLRPDDGEVYGLPVDIDMSWSGDAFALLTQDLVGLAEIVTKMRTGRDKGGPPG